MTVTMTMTKHFLSLALLAASAAAMHMPTWMNETTFCQGGLCNDPNLPFERKAAAQPGYQWGDAGGYCGSWASQRAMLAKGAWVSQQQVRDHTEPCKPHGGEHDNEILSCNIAEAWTNLKVDFEAFDYLNTPLPQTAAYSAWLKKQLVQGYAVAWMILWSGQAYPIYNLTAPMGMYGHVEPVIGIQSNHPLNDTKVYDDDVVMHYNDGGTQTIYRPISSLAGKWAGPGSKADCGTYSYCIGFPYGFGWAVKGFAPNDTHTASALPVSLAIFPWKREPDTRSGAKPDSMLGELTVTDLTVGKTYDIYRWDTVAEAFASYTDQYKKASFTATTDTHVYMDNKVFMSDGTTYYRVIPAN